jgi:hypothetical protein
MDGWGGSDCSVDLLVKCGLEKLDLKSVFLNNGKCEK